MIIVSGSGFGPQAQLGAATVVTIGNKVCQPTADVKALQGGAYLFGSDHSHIFCAVPSGTGERLPLIVSVGGRRSAVTNETLFSYDPPTIDSFSPNNPDANGVGQLTIRGTNFGDAAAPTRVLIGDRECGAATWETTVFVTCAPLADVVGAKNVSLWTGNHSVPAISWDVEEELV